MSKKSFKIKYEIKPKTGTFEVYSDDIYDDVSFNNFFKYNIDEYMSDIDFHSLVKILNKNEFKNYYEEVITEQKLENRRSQEEMDKSLYDGLKKKYGWK